MLSHACRVSADLLTLCEPAFQGPRVSIRASPHYQPQEQQLCVGTTVAVFNRHKKYTCRWEGQSSCNPASLKITVEYLGCTPEWQIRQESVAAAHNMIEAYNFMEIFREWLCMHKQSIPGHFSLLPHGLGMSGIWSVPLPRVQLAVTKCSHVRKHPVW